MNRNLQNKQLESLQTAMRARQTQLREEIRQALVKSDSEHYLQIADSVRELEDESFADLIVDVGLAEIDRDLDELRAIDAALLRMADGSYGICAACDRPIDVKRLNLTPQALRCIDCQTIFERTHFQKTGHTL
ncbi:MAG: TraR/DksA family transcriptional regulator [Steroidobacteraceae bacterium]|nr:TraR/DksA family transcriptional regulator [Pseudomonadota bacterium]MBP6105781.1 TraR/DksA family transcriptional regulator [Steroidobacteraceae bacterium]MBP7012318.1 TraR/DksA family transcriptional regulator [Steroidobacteraceae bacterium]